MTEDALEALRASDRPHSLEADGYERIERIMLDAYRQAEPAATSNVTTLPVDQPDVSGHRPTRGRALWIAVAAGLVVFGLGTVQLAGNEGEDSPSGGDVLGDYCQDHLDPTADALDLLRANPNQPNAAETHQLLGQALTELDENGSIIVDISDLIEDHGNLQPSPKTSDSLIGIANALGQRLASLTDSSPRCDYQRLAPNKDRATDPIGRPITDD